MVCIPVKNGKAEILAPLFVIFGFLMMATASVLPYKAVVQLGAIGLIVVGLQLLVRYVLCEHRYIIEDLDNGTSELIVYKLQGKREEKVCHVAVHNITDVYRKGERCIKADACYNYSQNIGAVPYDVIFEDGTRTVKVILEANEEFVDVLRARMLTRGNGEGTAFAM